MYSFIIINSRHFPISFSISQSYKDNYLIILLIICRCHILICIWLLSTLKTLQKEFLHSYLEIQSFFVKKDGLLSLLYLYRRGHVVLEKPKRVLEIANKTVETLEKNIEKYRNGPKSLFDLQYSRNNYMMNFNLIIP